MYVGSYQHIVEDPIEAPRASELLLARMGSLHPTEIDLSLDRIKRLLAELGHPERRLPPVVHIAGTNGKGSTLAFLRAILEADGAHVHTYTSPHLMKFNERIRLAAAPGRSSPIGEDDLADCLSRVEAVNAGRGVTFFEITTAAAFLAFSERPADVLLLETGMGGRLDATNVIDAPRVTAITEISLDHTAFLGPTVAHIAREKAGIMKPGAPCVIGPQNPQAMRVLEERADAIGAPPVRFGVDFDAFENGGRLVYSSRARNLNLPLPGLRGAHQIVNAGVAIAAVEAGFADRLKLASLERGLRDTHWAGRLESLGKGTLSACVERGTEIIVDGGHNPGGASAVARALDGIASGRDVHVVYGMISGKDARGVFEAFAGRAARIYTVPIPGRSDGISADELCEAGRSAGCKADPARGLIHALLMSRAAMRGAGVVLICGSIYLVGHALEVHDAR